MKINNPKNIEEPNNNSTISINQKTKQRRKIFLSLGLGFVLLMTGLFYLSYKSRQARIFKVENAIFDLSKVNVLEEINLDFTPSSTLRASRTTEGIYPSYIFKARNLFGTPYTEFDKPFTITINYDKADLTEVHEETLAVYWFDPKQYDNWERLPTILYTKNQRATAQSNRLGTFSLIGNLKIPPPSIGHYTKEFPLSEWKTSQNKELNFQISFHPNWQIDREEYDEKGGVLALTALGDDQAAGPHGTELFDGAKVSLIISVETEKTPDQYIQELTNAYWYQNTITRNVEKRKIGLIDYYVAEYCGQDNRYCDTSYLTYHNGKTYRIDVFAIGENAMTFYEIAIETVASLTFKK